MRSNNIDLLGKYVSEADATMEMWIAKLGLSYNSYAVLYSLAAAENQGLTQKQISEEWFLPKQTVFNICKEFKAKGWIEFRESATDKRERMMYLTDVGQAKAEPVWQLTDQLSQKTFAVLGKQKTTQLFALLQEFSRICQKQMEEIPIEIDN
ncbi:MarR family winged helix-turn-helix transcriptional regulator [Gallibacterium melopsittaci]|uniref:MarR family winged helix-turn-helix transcriptional regulator n=1 Tax=Gallibacterium melopsittaci TaxID=516063 RepID=A0ABV6HXS0_9PAST